MHFIVKRYIHGVSVRRVWLLLILIVPLTYLGMKAMCSDRFLVKQDILITEDWPVASASHPLEFKPMSAIAANPEALFRDRLAIRDLYDQLYGGTPGSRDDSRLQDLVSTVRGDMSLVMSDDETARISYYGKDEQVGTVLVGYYARRLVRKAEEGRTRSKQQAFKRAYSKRENQPAIEAAQARGRLDAETDSHESIAGLIAEANAAVDPGSSQETQTSGRGPGAVVGLLGSIEVKPERAVWRSDRLWPLSQVFFVSLCAVFVFLAGLEWADPSFKSERQVGRYLDLPILGSLPDLTKVFQALGGKNSS